jgi:SAM-dependent methyltransferase
MAYKAATYWEERLSRDYSLTGVGHQSFNRYYNQWLYRRKRKVLGSALSEEKLQAARVLDVGAGTGFFVRWYAERGALVDGVDISPTAVSRLSETFPGRAFYLADFAGDELSLPGSYDIINAWDVLYHQVSGEAFRRFLERVSALLAPGGLFLATDALGCSSAQSAAPHVVFRPAAAYQAILEPLDIHLVQCLPLYQYLNRPFLPSRMPKAVYGFLAPLLYVMDRQQEGISKDNLSLGLWQKRTV